MATLAEKRTARLAKQAAYREAQAERKRLKKAREVREKKLARYHAGQARKKREEADELTRRQIAEMEAARDAQRDDLDRAEAIISRAQAIALGLKMYRTGEACRNGHRTCRAVHSGHCLKC